jgi:hypothetical protein
MMKVNFILLITFENNRLTWFYENLEECEKDKEHYFSEAKERGIVSMEIFRRED